MAQDYLKTLEWKETAEPVPYPQAVEWMEARVEAIHQGSRPCIWLLEHPPLYTAGASAKPGDLLKKNHFPVYASGRGGQYTYHGPGQRVAYVLVDLKQLFAPQPPDLREYIRRLEQWIITTLDEFEVEGFTREGRTGVWVRMTDDAGQITEKPSSSSALRHLPSESKIAAIGVRVRKWVAYHGISLNVNPDLAHYSGIVPCGIADAGVTSLAAQGIHTTLQEVDVALKRNIGVLAP